MGALAAIIGAIGGLCAVFGIVTVFEVPLGLSEPFTDEMFWFALAGVLLLGSIAMSVGRGGRGSLE